MYKNVVHIHSENSDKIRANSPITIFVFSKYRLLTKKNSTNFFRVSKNARKLRSKPTEYLYARTCILGLSALIRYTCVTYFIQYVRSSLYKQVSPLTRCTSSCFVLVLLSCGRVVHVWEAVGTIERIQNFGQILPYILHFICVWRSRSLHEVCCDEFCPFMVHGLLLLLHKRKAKLWLPVIICKK